MDLALLGPLEVRTGDSAIAVGPPKERAILGLLALNAGKPVSTAQLIEALWEESPPRSAHKAVQTYISNLRHRLSYDVITTTTTGYLLALAPESVDALRFEGLIASGRKLIEEGNSPAAIATLGNALSLWRGQPLTELSHSAVGRAEVVRLEELHRSAVEDLTDARLAIGQHAAMVPILEAAVIAEPLRERRWAHLMLALYRCGRQADALRAYARARELLAEELGLEPGSPLRELERAILEQRADLEWIEVSPTTDLVTAQAADREADLPSGTVTFLFSDIEGSTRLLARLGERYRPAMERHRQLLRQAARAEGGVEVNATGDELFFAFPGAAGAVKGAVAGQEALANEPWPDGLTLKVRMGMHTGEAEARGRDYVAIAVHRAARVAAAAHGGQILASAETVAAIDTTDAPIQFTELGRYSLKDFNQPASLFQVDRPGPVASFPALRARTAATHNLPSSLTSFIGRENQVREVQKLFCSNRLVTVVGPGGCGKTRVSLEVGERMLEECSGGVWFVDLSPVSDAGLVAQSVADVLSIRDESSRPLLESLKAALADRELLLVVDNCEHLIEGCALVVEQLLASSPALRVLATSRERLGVAGERVWPLPSLTLPTPDHATSEAVLGCESVRLFLDRAWAVNPDLTVGDRDVAVLVDIVVRLDGSPLALELAAARMGVLSLVQVARRLEDRFRLLTAGPRTAQPRQQTLAGAIEWSHDLLLESEQVAFRRLSVFAGSFSLDAAEALAPDADAAASMLDLIEALVSKSLLSVDRQNEDVRYRFLETIRAYASTKLAASGEDDSQKDRHLKWALRLAQEIRPSLDGPDAPKLLDVLEAEHDNLRAALDFSLTGSARDGHSSAERQRNGFELAACVGRFWEVRSYLSEGRRWLERFLTACPDIAPQLRVTALLSIAEMSFGQRDASRGRQASGEALELSLAGGDRRSAAEAYASLGNFALHMGQVDEARRHLHAAISIGRELGDKLVTAQALTVLGAAEGWGGEFHLGKQLLEEARQLLAELGELNFRSNTIQLLGELSTDQALYDEAQAHHEESLALRTALGDRHRISNLLGCLAHCHLGRGDLAAARHYAEQYLDGSREFGDRGGICYSLGVLGEVARVEGDLGAARELLEAGIAAIPEGTDPFSRLIAQNRLGRVATMQGRLDEAAKLHHDALAAAVSGHDAANIPCSLEGRAQIAVSVGEPRRSVWLLSIANSHRRRVGAPLPTYLASEYQATLDQLRTEVGGADFDALWSEGQVASTDAAIDYVLQQQS